MRTPAVRLKNTGLYSSSVMVRSLRAFECFRLFAFQIELLRKKVGRAAEPGRQVLPRHFTSISSTSKISVAFPGITGGRPSSP